LVVAALAGTAVWLANRPTESTPHRISRLLITGSLAGAGTNAADRGVAITPDGSRVIYVGNNGTQLLVRALDALAPVAVFTGAPRAPFVSPDGQWIGFVDGVTSLKKVAVTGGPATTLASVDAAVIGASWVPDDTIIFATQNAVTGLQRISATGGATTILTRPDRAQGEADHLWPEVLPGGRAALFTITAQTGGVDATQIAVLDLQTSERQIVVRGGSHARYVPSGHLLYTAAGTLRAVAFDLAGVKTRGTPVPVIADAVISRFGDVDAAVAGDGTLAYVSGGSASRARSLVWVDRQGRETPISAPPHGYTFPRLSPDGTRVAVFLAEQDTDIWMVDLGHGTFQRVTHDPGVDIHPVWTPDGRQLIFTSTREGGIRNLFRQAWDGTGGVERLTDSPNPQNAVAVSPDGSLADLH
jgi:serine/threonine-protein kinase